MCWFEKFNKKLYTDFFLIRLFSGYTFYRKWTSELQAVRKIVFISEFVSHVFSLMLCGENK